MHPIRISSRSSFKKGQRLEAYIVFFHMTSLPLLEPCRSALSSRSSTATARPLSLLLACTALCRKHSIRMDGLAMQPYAPALKQSSRSPLHCIEYSIYLSCLRVASLALNISGCNPSVMRYVSWIVCSCCTFVSS